MENFTLVLKIFFRPINSHIGRRQGRIEVFDLSLSYKFRQEPDSLAVIADIFKFYRLKIFVKESVFFQPIRRLSLCGKISKSEEFVD